MKNFIALLLLGFAFFGCKQVSNGDFCLSVRHYGGAAGIIKIYRITNQKISLETNCDFENCESKIVYQRAIKKIEADSFYSFLTTSGITELKSKYIDENVLDGLQSHLNYDISGLGSEEIQISNVQVPVAERIYKEIDKYIDSANFRFYNGY